MRGLGYNYPAGAEHDPSAPWNMEDADDCETCNGRGSIGEGDDTEDCPACFGSGREDRRQQGDGEGVWAGGADHYIITRPPSTPSTCPVTYEASRDAR